MLVYENVSIDDFYTINRVYSTRFFRIGTKHFIFLMRHTITTQHCSHVFVL